MTDDDLQAIRQRAENATPGPWHSDESAILGPNGEDVAWVRKSLNNNFVTHSRTDIPALLAEIDRLRSIVRPS